MLMDYDRQDTPAEDASWGEDASRGRVTVQQPSAPGPRDPPNNPPTFHSGTASVLAPLVALKRHRQFSVQSTVDQALIVQITLVG